MEYSAWRMVLDELSFCSKLAMQPGHWELGAMAWQEIQDHVGQRQWDWNTGTRLCGAPVVVNTEANPWQVRLVKRDPEPQASAS